MKFTLPKILLGFILLAFIFNSCFKDELKKEIDDLRGQLTTMQKKNDSLNNVLNVRADSLSKALSAAQKRSDSLSNILKTKSDSLSNALGITNANLAALSKSVDSIKTQITSINGQLTQLNSQLASLTTQLNLLNQQLAALGGDISQLASQYQTLNASLQDINTQIALLQAEQLKLLAQLNAILLQLNPPVDIITGLVAYYPFSGNADDSSGNGNNGIVTGAQLAADRFGRGNSSYYFNGQTDWISITSKPSLLPNNISLSFWVKIPNNYTANNQIGRMIRSRFFGYYIQYDSISHNITFQIHTDNDANAGPNIASTDGIQYNDNKWHLVTGTFDGAKINLYIDGNLKSTVNPRTSNIYYQSDGAILLGKDGNSSSPLAALFQGWIDEVRIYNRALSQSEITYLATH